MRARPVLSVLALAALVACGGCAPVISRGVRDRADKTLTFEAVIKNPEAYKEKTVIWGGVIVSAKNLQEGTLLEIVQKPLDFQLCPKKTDESGGRFLALYEGFLDSVIYGKGREVTVAGEIKGKRVFPLDEIEYAYPLIQVLEVFLWQQAQKDIYMLTPMGYPIWYGTWSYRALWGPWW